MLAYFEQFFLHLDRGICYILTNFALMTGAILLLNDIKATVKGFLSKALECLVCFVALTLMLSAYYALFGGWQMDRSCLVLFLLAYSLLRSKYKRRVCAVRSFVYFASTLVMLPLSEPLGRYFSDINPVFFLWAQYLTLMVVMLMTGTMVFFLRHFSFDTRSIVHPQFTFMMIVISLLTILSQVCAMTMEESGGFNLVICCILWLINLLAYYMFYVISRITQENISLITMRHKAEMELEKYQVTKMNFEELRIIRHEIKNHQFYMKALLDEGKLDGLKEYLQRTAMDESIHLQEFDCGNSPINVILNHAMGVARVHHVKIQTEVLVSPTLPFPEEEMCSLLTNLLDNAIEAATVSNAENPQVYIRIQPRQDYLFIKIINNVNDQVSPQRRLSLRTTKQNRELHGYGTQIIRRIVERHNGSIKYSMSEDRRSFVTDVMLELPKEE